MRPSTTGGGGRGSKNQKQVDFIPPSASKAAASLSPTEARIVQTVERLQTLVGTETKWKNRIISSVSTCSGIDISVQQMDDFIKQCEARIIVLREDVVKIAQHQLSLVSFDPNQYKTWFEQLGSDPSGAAAPPAAVASYHSQVKPAPGSPGALLGGSEGKKKSSSSSSSSKSHGSSSSGKSKAQHGNQAAFLDNVPVPETFWQRRETQKNALASVYLSFFDLPRLHREHAAGGRPTTGEEMLFHLKEATRLSAASTGGLKELLNEHKSREKEVLAGNTIDKTSGRAIGTGKKSSSSSSSSSSSGGRAPPSPGGGQARAGSRPTTAPASGGSSALISSMQEAPETHSMKMCVATGIFVHDPSADELALTTELRTHDLFDVGSPRCLDSRVLHRIMILRSRKLRLEECINIFNDEKAQLMKRQELQKEMTGLGQYSLFAAQADVTRSQIEEKALQKQRQEEIAALGSSLSGGSGLGATFSGIGGDSSPGGRSRR